MAEGLVLCLWEPCGQAGGSVSSRSVISGPDQTSAQLFYRGPGGGVGRDERVGTAAGVQHSRMVAPAELSSNLGERLVGELACEVHGHLSGPSDTGCACGGEQLIGGHPELLAGGGLDLRDRSLWCGCVGV